MVVLSGHGASGSPLPLPTIPVDTQIGAELFETTANDNVNMEEVFCAITRLVLNTKKESAKDGGTKDTIKVNKSSGIFLVETGMHFPKWGRNCCRNNNHRARRPLTSRSPLREVKGL